jgi:type I restriction enzyme M protein
MLDTNTKKRIDDCRDILVGKLPDPKSQIDQITLALIYKFMDDMDQQSKSYGGVSSFFVNDFEKYSWSNIMSAHIGANDMLKLYSEGIEKMSENETIQPLFRSIFKDAYLPYRDPETLKMFLKKINEFSYDHSEVLGDAFEYLLSVMGSQGDAGQFRTPRHIIDFMVDITSPKKDETILDPSCGTSGFLISAYKKILSDNTKERPGDLLSSMEKKKLLGNVSGYDISPDMIRLSLANLFLHGFNEDNLKIFEYDTLSSLDRWNEYYDVILANPPFMTPKGGIRPHNRFSIKSNRAEVLFVNYIMEHLTPKGRAAIIVPEGIIFQSGNAYKDLRKSLIEKSLIGVISLPSGVFNPYSGVKTSILILDRELSQKTDKIFFGKVENDGYDLGAQRREIDRNDLPKIKDGVLEYVNNLTNGIDEEHSSLSYVSKEEILNSNDIGFSFERYNSIEIDSNVESKYLKEFIELSRGVVYKKSQELDNSNTKVLRANNIDLNTHKIDFNNIKCVSQEVKTKENQKVKKDDIIICLASGSKKHIGKVALIDKDYGYYVGGFMGILRTNDFVLPKYLFYNLINKKFNKYLIRVLNSTSINNLSKKILDDFKIPLPSLEIQKEIVEELEQYQKVIDGAKQVVDNFKPHFDIDVSWEKIKVDDIGLINNLNFRKFDKKQYTYIDISSVKNGGGEIDLSNKLKKENLPSRAKRMVKRNDIIISSVRPNLQSFSYINFDPIDTVVSTGFMVLSVSDKFDFRFIYYSFYSNHIMNQLLNKMGKGSYPSINQNDFKELNMYVPSIENQKQIGEKLEEERLIVEGNKKLIEVYTQKIEDRINKIWGS